MPDDADLIDALTAAMFGRLRAGESLYAILDAARNHEIPFRLRAAGVEHECLYRGQEAEHLWYVAPYVLRCERDSEFFVWALRAGWCERWGIFAVADVSLPEVLQHFRSHVRVRLDGRQNDFYFRFYDPRVLRSFVRACTAQEAEAFFGPVRCFLVEGHRRTDLLVIGPDRTSASADVRGS
jgi:hypothetical protein